MALFNFVVYNFAQTNGGIFGDVWTFMAKLTEFVAKFAA